MFTSPSYKRDAKHLAAPRGAPRRRPRRAVKRKQPPSHSKAIFQKKIAMRAWVQRTHCSRLCVECYGLEPEAQTKREYVCFGGVVTYESICTINRI